MSPKPYEFFDRSKALYRVFDLTDENDGRNRVWFTVEGNMPGREVSVHTAKYLESYVAMQPWAPAFEAAFLRNKKATLYDTPPVENAERNLSWYFWKFVHNALVHPLLAFPWEPKWVQKAHDWTSKRCLGGG